MLKDFVKRLIDDNEKEVKKLRRIAEDINSLEDDFRKLADEDFPKKTQEFRDRLENGADFG